jgi:hypothetical protein
MPTGRFRSFPFAGIILIRWLRVVPEGLSDVSNTPNEPLPSYRTAGLPVKPLLIRPGIPTDFLLASSQLASMR